MHKTEMCLHHVLMSLAHVVDMKQKLSFSKYLHMCHKVR